MSESWEDKLDRRLSTDEKKYILGYVLDQTEATLKMESPNVLKFVESVRMPSDFKLIMNSMEPLSFSEHPYSVLSVLLNIDAFLLKSGSAPWEEAYENFIEAVVDDLAWSSYETRKAVVEPFINEKFRNSLFWSAMIALIKKYKEDRETEIKNYDWSRYALDYNSVLLRF